MPAKQAVVLEGGDKREGRRAASPRASWLRRNRAVLALAGIAFGSAFLVNAVLFPHYSGDADEPIYRFQAEMLLDGKLTLSAAEQQHFFRPWLSGPVGDRIVMAFSPGWPAVLAVSRLFTGSMLTAVGLAAAGAAMACYLFARELLGDRRAALVGAFMLALSPMFLVLGGTYLNYVFALGLELTAAWMLLRGLRTGGRGWLVGAGLAAGFAFVTRPYDAVLVAGLLGAYALWTRRVEPATTVRRLGWVAAGGLPFVAATLVYNAAVCGDPLEFPTQAQSGGEARFFFGYRSLAPGIAGYDYTPARALHSLWSNLHPTPTWFAGSLVGIALAGYGLHLVWRRDRRAAVLLSAMTALFPLGYLLWWASTLTVAGALHGLGPHYYLPMFVPLAILAGVAAVDLWSRRRAVLVVTGVAGLVLTAYSADPKIDEKRYLADIHRGHARAVEQAIDAAGDGDKVVILQRQRYAYLMGKWPYLGNRPDLEGEVLYAIDRGADATDLVERFPGRDVVRLVRRLESGDDITKPSLVAEPVSSVRGEALELRLRAPESEQPPRYVVAYVRQAGRTARVLLEPSPAGTHHEITWRISADGAVTTTDAGGAELQLLDGKGRVSFGMFFSDSPVLFWANRRERRYDYRIVDGDDGETVEVLLADEEWHRFPTGWLPIDLSDTFVAEWEAVTP